MLTTSLLTAPIGNVQESRHGCRFTWSVNDSSISLAPVGSSNLMGAVAVDVVASANHEAASAAEALLSVIVDCPNTRRLEAQRRLPVLQSLRLTAPVVDGGCAGSATLLRVPPSARIPLVFSQASEHLQISLLDAGAGAGGRPVAELQDQGESVELVAGPEEGEVLAVVRDQRAGSLLPPLMVTVGVRIPHGLRLSPSLPKKLPLHASAELRVHLVDASGAALALSSSALATHSVSHPSVLASQLVQTAEGGAFLKVRAIREGCFSVAVSVEVPLRGARSKTGASSKMLMSDLGLVCVSPGALVGRHQHLHVQPGAAIHFGLDMLGIAGRTGALEEESLAFSMRLLLPAEYARPLDEIGRQLSDEMSVLLRLSSESVSTLDLRWVIDGQVRPCACISAVLDADIQITSHDLPTGTGPAELLERLWLHPELFTSGSLLRFVDLGHGVRAPLHSSSMEASPRNSFASSTCSGSPGLSSSVPGVLLVTGGADNEATTASSGGAVAQMCSGGVSADVDVVVTTVSQIRTEVQPGGPLLGTGQISNAVGDGPLVVSVRFLTREGVEFFSGPFQSQNLQFDCYPSDAALTDFFTFDQWHPFNVSSAQLFQRATDSTPAPWGPGLPQAACVVQPKGHDVHRWAKLAAPATLNLHVSMRPVASSVDLELPAWTSLEWSFVPQFVVHDDKGKQFVAGETCGVLTLSQPTVTFWVWTGGHPVEASLGQQLQGTHRGVLAVHVSEPPDTLATPPTISVAVVWDEAVPFHGFEEVDLRLESRVSGQMQTCKVRIDGSPSSYVQEAVLPTSSRLNLPQLLLLCLLACCLGCCLCLCSGSCLALRERLFGPPSPGRVLAGQPAAANLPGGLWAGGYGVQQPTTFPTAPTASLHAGQAPTPFRRVDLRPY